MRTRRKLFISLACLALIAALVAILTHDPEPRYRGRSFSKWFALWSTSCEYDDPQSRAQTEEAAQAIRAIGTNALPILLKRLRQYPSDTRLRIEDFLYETLPPSVSRSATARRLFSRKQPLELTSAFGVLGPIASPAVPELNLLLRATNVHPEISRRAAYCLVAIGKDGLPPLVYALSKPQLECYLAIESLSRGPLIQGQSSYNKTNLVEAVSVLATNTMSKDPDFAKLSITALGLLKAQPQIAIPALVISLDSPDAEFRRRAVDSLAQFGSEAVRPLAHALNDPDETVRRLATNWLASLAPQHINAPSR